MAITQRIEGSCYEYDFYYTRTTNNLGNLDQERLLEDMIRTLPFQYYLVTRDRLSQTHLVRFLVLFEME